jgi:hypothetical protein
MVAVVRLSGAGYDCRYAEGDSCECRREVRKV